MAAELKCNLVTDPICGASFDQDKAVATYQLEGFTYYFCSSACRDKFAQAAFFAGTNS